MSTMRSGRLPDFIIIGAAKSGTTSLINWLAEQPEVGSPRVKEPDFFSVDRVWRRGPDWYATVFADAASHRLCGEASTSYTELRHADKAAHRMAAVVPQARLIYVMRHPIERLRSHYRHEIQRGRERRPLAAAIAAPQNEYVGSSLYFTCLEPYIQVFARDQICVVRLEDLVDRQGTGWQAILDHLGLTRRAKPEGVWNRTEDKPGLSRALSRLEERGILPAAKHVPGPVRKLAKALLTRTGPAYERRLKRSNLPISWETEQRIWKDIERLEDWLDAASPLWSRSDPVASSTG